MRKRTYEVLRALENCDIVSHLFCKLDDMSSRVRNEIYELRNIYDVEIHSEGSFVGRHSAYFLVGSKKNLRRVKMLLKTHKKEETQKILK